MGRPGWAELVFLLSAVLCLEATLKYKFYLSEPLEWADARKDCQKEHQDIVNWPVMSELDQGAMLSWPDKVWVGLLRDQDQESVWRWTNLESGEGSSGEDVSHISAWADEHPVAHCAFVEERWKVAQCQRKRKFYCSIGNKIEHYEQELNWNKASDFCQARKGFLATVDETNQDQFQFFGWIGLYRIGGDKWDWVGNVSSEYTNWSEGGPSRLFDCGTLEDGQLFSRLCRAEIPAVCFEDNLVVVNENKTWEEAVSHCREMEVTSSDSTGARQHNYDLLSLTHRSHYNYTRVKIAKATTDEVWTGLRFLGGGWWWLDGTDVELHNLLPDCPSERNRCGALSKYDSNFLTTSDCSERRNFICAKVN